MDDRVRKLKTPAECESFAKNAKGQGRDDLALQAKQRAVELRAVAYGATSDAERACLEAVFAYEEILSARNGKRTRASRTWQMIKRHGIIAATERAVDRPDETAGFAALEEAGLGQYAFEAVILRHPDLFSESALVRSRERMSGFGA
ncbi:hypothetical protein J2X06_003028 [Lysobacter niastensis]|jgi:hypothetical protein|uniref:Uncharacterized protein n=1 Tax=Lysobacter niastensis TaxID=380629 RepID=A0ABU1WEH6_9GAMM|nr:hypothetical protein [Lysobacter niastensis]MDR7135810.1 hypothetical protein [Lysobacter niastensis]